MSQFENRDTTGPIDRLTNSNSWRHVDFLRTLTIIQDLQRRVTCSQIKAIVMLSCDPKRLTQFPGPSSQQSRARVSPYAPRCRVIMSIPSSGVRAVATHHRVLLQADRRYRCSSAFHTQNRRVRPREVPKSIALRSVLPIAAGDAGSLSPR